MGLLVSLRLAFMRVNRALSVIAESPNKSFDPAQSFKAVYEAYWQPLTSIISVKGDAMAPTLNAPATSNEGTVERLLMRLLHAPVLGREETGGVFPGDVVAFQSPVVKTARRDILVRRVAATEGQELVTDDPEEPSYVLPPGHCWVLADNEKLDPPAVLDSRVFGPLPAKLICGRILYYGRPLDHGPVHNSPQATSEDAPVLASELDVDKLTSVATDELQAH